MNWVRLFERGSRGVRLTGSGQQFMTYAQQIVETVAAAENAARRSGEGEIGTLALGLTSSAGDVLPKQNCRPLIAAIRRSSLHFMRTTLMASSTSYAATFWIWPSSERHLMMTV